MSRDVAVGLQLSGSQPVLAAGVVVRKGELRVRRSRGVARGGQAAVLLAMGGRQTGRRVVARAR